MPRPLHETQGVLKSYAHETMVQLPQKFFCIFRRESWRHLLKKDEFAKELAAHRRSLHPGHPVLIVVIGGGRRTDSTLAWLELLRVWHGHHKTHICVLAMNSGELYEEFRAVSDFFLRSPAQRANGNDGTLKTLRKELPKWRAGRDLRAVIDSGVPGEIISAFGAANIPLTAFVHAFAETINEKTTQALFHNAQRLLFPSRCVRSSLRRAFADLPAPSIGSPELDVMPFGAFPSFLQPFKADDGLRGQHGIPAEAFVILGTGDDNCLQGIDLFARTAERISQKHTEDGRPIHFVFVAASASGPVGYQLEPLLRMDSEAVHFVEPPAEMRHWLRSADAFFLSGRLDPVASVVFEAMSVGLPVLAFEDGAGPAEFIADFGGGTVVPSLDVGAAVDALERWSRQGTEDLGREAADAVQKEADWGAYAERVWSAVHNDTRGARRICKYGDVKTLLKDVENIRREFPRPTTAIADFRPPTLAPEVHRCLKSLSQPILTPQRVSTLRLEVEAIADRLIAQMKAKDASPDLFADYARPFVGEAMMLFLGIPAEKADALFRSAALIPLGIPVEQLDTDHEALIAKMFAGYNSILAEVYDKPAPAGSLIATLQAAEADGKMTRGQTQDTLACSLDGGLTSLLQFVFGMLHYFACFPDQWKEATQEAGKIPSVVEEMMRFLSPASLVLWGRALNDTTTTGCPLTRGERVELDIYEANRDPEVFSRPHEVLFDRPEKQHLALGHGPHFCLGAAPARLVGQVAIERLSAGWGELGLAQKVAPAIIDKAWGYIPELIITQHNKSHETRAGSRTL